MQSPKLTRRAAGALILAAGLEAMHAQAQTPAAPWPTKPISLVVPYAAGGSTDITARLVAQKLSVELGQPIVIDNRAGAGGSVSAAYVARSAPDGYTLLATVGSHAINMKLFKNPTYDLVKDFTGVGQVLTQPYVLVANKNLPARNLQELVTLIRQDTTGKLNYASGGVGSSNHLAGALLNQMAGGHMVHVAYRSGALATQALLAGEVQLFIGVVLDVLPQIKAGTVKPIAVATKNRYSGLPDLPAIAEVLPGYDVGAWTGLMAPARTPAPIIARLNAALNKVLADPELQAAFAAQGGLVAPSTPEGFTKFVASEVAAGENLVNISGVTPQ